MAQDIAFDTTAREPFSGYQGLLDEAFWVADLNGYNEFWPKGKRIRKNQECADFIWEINSGRKICSLKPDFAIGGLRYSKTRLYSVHQHKSQKIQNGHCSEWFFILICQYEQSQNRILGLVLCCLSRITLRQDLNGRFGLSYMSFIEPALQETFLI